MPSLVASHRVRVTLWFQASRYVPASISRATSGATQKAPTTAGATAITTRPALYSFRSVGVSASSTAAGWARAMSTSRGPVTARVAAKPTTAVNGS